MKILLIHNYGQYRGGAETYLESLSLQLEKKGYKIIKYFKDSRKIDLIFNKIKVALGLFYSTKTKKELEELIKKEKPDIAQVLNIYPLVTASVYHILKSHKIPISQRIQDYRLLCPKATLFRNGKVCELCISKSFKYPSFIYGCYQKSRLASLIFATAFYFHTIIGSYKKIDKYIFPTEFVRDYYLKYTKVEKEKSVVIPTFTNINESKVDKNIRRKNDHFLYFGRLSEEKGIIQLLEVFKALPSIKLVVIGNGPLMNKVKRFSSYKNIIVKGFLARNNILKYIKSASAVIIPSLWYDVMPNVLIESITQGVPVIVPRFGVFPELVKKHQGFFYEQNDFKSLKSLIFKISNRKKVLSIIDDQFIPERHISKLTKLYKRLSSQN